MANTSTIPLLPRLRKVLSFGVPTLYTLIGLGVTLLVFCTLAGAILHLTSTYWTERAKTQRLALQVQQAQITRDRLAGRFHYLNSPDGKVATVIEHGGVKPGDEAISFTPQQPAAAPTPATTTADATAAGGLLLAALTLCLLAFLIGIGLLVYRKHAQHTARPNNVLTPRSELKHPAPGR
jgi:type II secretory pathway pseudopilin PulG